MKRTLTLLIASIAMTFSVFTASAVVNFSRVWTTTKALPGFTANVGAVDGNFVPVNWQGAYYDGAFFIQNYDVNYEEANKYSLNDATGDVTNGYTYTTGYGVPIATDDAGNIIIGTSSAIYSQQSFNTTITNGLLVIPPDGSTTYTIGLSDPVVTGTDWFFGHVVGNVLSSAGGYLYTLSASASPEATTIHQFHIYSVPKSGSIAAYCDSQEITATGDLGHVFTYSTDGTNAQHNGQSSIVQSYTIGSKEYLFIISRGANNDANFGVRYGELTSKSATSITLSPLFTYKSSQVGAVLFNTDSQDFIAYPYVSADTTNTNHLFGNGIAVKKITQATDGTLSVGSEVAKIGSNMKSNNYTATAGFGNWLGADASGDSIEIYQFVPGQCFAKYGFKSVTDGVSSLKCTAIEPIMGERAIDYDRNRATATTGSYYRHYRLTFPSARISWTQTLPTGCSYVTSDLTVGSRTFSGISDPDATNHIDLYGIYGAKTASIVFTLHNTDGTTTTATETVDLDYFGKTTLTDNGVNIGQIKANVFNNGNLVAQVAATDDKTGGYIPCFYEPLRSPSTSDDGDLSNYSNSVLTPSPSDCIINTSVMKSQKIYMVTPSFSDLYKTITAGTSPAEDITVNYAIVPHYLMVTSGPFTADEMKTIVKTESGSINTLQDSYTIGTTTYTADLLYAAATDVRVSNIAGSPTIANHKLCTFPKGALPTGVNGAAAASVSVVGGQGFISVAGAHNATVYTPTGHIVASMAQPTAVNVPAGIYIVRADNTIVKVVVK